MFSLFGKRFIFRGTSPHKYRGCGPQYSVDVKTELELHKISKENEQGELIGMLPKVLVDQMITRNPDSNIYLTDHQYIIIDTDKGNHYFGKIVEDDDQRWDADNLPLSLFYNYTITTIPTVHKTAL